MDTTRNSDLKVMGLFLVLGWIFNMSTWFHPLFFPAIKWTILAMLPFILIMGLKKPHYMLWFVFLIFFTQDAFPNNVIYETYYGHEATTVYFHNFISILSVFDIVLLGSIYIILLRKLKEHSVKNIFNGRIEYSLILLVVFISLIIALTRGNEFKTIVQEIQLWVYAAVLYFIVSQTILDIKILYRSILFWILLLFCTIPFEFMHYILTNYHSLVSVVGRLRKPLLNGTDDAYMVIPIFILLCWVVQNQKETYVKFKFLSTLGILIGLSIIYLNNGRMLCLLMILGFLLFLAVQRLNPRIYVLFSLIAVLLFTINMYFEQEYIGRLTKTFTSIFSAVGNYRNDESTADRVMEFMNVAKTLEVDKAQLFGLGWGGLWREYYYQPGRGSLAAYADKTLTTHQQTHTLFSQLFVKCGYLGTSVIILCFLSLWIHFFKVYCKHSNPIMLGLLIAYPIYFYFSTILQLGIALGIIIAFLRKMELFGIQNPGLSL